ncbi:MAG: hypothetical protein ACKO26_17305 [Planctomycetota bacterium]
MKHPLFAISCETVENLMGDLDRLDAFENTEFEAALDELRHVLFRIMTWKNIHDIFGHNDECDDLPDT